MNQYHITWLYKTFGAKTFRTDLSKLLTKVINFDVKHFENLNHIASFFSRFFYLASPISIAQTKI
jgi:hypothetical protein